MCATSISDDNCVFSKDGFKIKCFRLVWYCEVVLTKLQVRIFFCNVCKKRACLLWIIKITWTCAKGLFCCWVYFYWSRFHLCFLKKALCHMSYPGLFVCNYDGCYQDRTFLLQRKHSHGHFVQHPPSLITISCKHPSYEIILQSRNIHFSPSV